MTYSSIVYRLLTQRQQKTIHIKLPVPITNSKTILSSTLHKLCHN